MVYNPRDWPGSCTTDICCDWLLELVAFLFGSRRGFMVQGLVRPGFGFWGVLQSERPSGDAARDGCCFQPFG